MQRSFLTRIYTARWFVVIAVFILWLGYNSLSWRFLLTNHGYYGRAYRIVKNYTGGGHPEFHSISPNTEPPNKGQEKPITILFWTSWFDERFPIHTKARNCLKDYRPQCNYSYDKTLAFTADALVFHIWDMSWVNIPDKGKRSADQIYVYYSMEPASYTPAAHKNVAAMTNFFNWTMTRYMGSDVGVPLGFIEQNQFSVTNRSFSQIIAGKTLPIAWFVSKCTSHGKRENFVKRLRANIQVDVYGSCGNLTCSRKNEQECYKMAAAKYFFYLAFENSVCIDYVTEKFWLIIKHDIVPVVLKRSIVESFAPLHSFIAVDDFRSMDTFVEYLRYLMKNMTAYGEYLEWKNQGYTVHTASTPRTPNDLCSLCVALHRKPVLRKSYADLHGWLNASSQCIAGFADSLLLT